MSRRPVNNFCERMVFMMMNNLFKSLKKLTVFCSRGMSFGLLTDMSGEKNYFGVFLVSNFLILQYSCTAQKTKKFNLNEVWDKLIEMCFFSISINKRLTFLKMFHFDQVRIGPNMLKYSHRQERMIKGESLHWMKSCLTVGLRSKFSHMSAYSIDRCVSMLKAWKWCL